MIVELLTAIDAGRQTLAAGVIADLPNEDAERLVSAGLAKPVGASYAVQETQGEEPPAKPKRRG